MLVTKQFQFQLASIVFFVHTTEVDDNQNGLVTIIFQNILFLTFSAEVTGLKRHEGE